MNSILANKRKRAARDGRPTSKKSRRIAAYHSSSSESVNEDEFDVESTATITNAPSNPTRSRLSNPSDQEDQCLKTTEATIPSSSSASDSDSQSSHSSASSEPISTTSSQCTIPKRTDPTAFANSISAILNSKLTTTKRADPLLSRSKEALATSRAKSDSQLESAARRKLRAERVVEKEKGRVRDVLGVGGDSRHSQEGLAEEGDDSKLTGTEGVQEEEKRLKRTAQRGVVKLFNAVRAAQVSAMEAQDKGRREGLVGMERRKERVDEMSKRGFLDMLNASSG